MLQRISEQYGDIAAFCALSSPFLKSWAYESIAKVISNLMNHSANTMPLSMMEFICTTVKDLIYFQIQVDWLLPYLSKGEAILPSDQEADSYSFLFEKLNRSSRGSALGIQK